VDTTFEILGRAAELRAERRPFVLATVTVSRKPASARAGSRAVITRDGALFGWVGGACSQPSVVRHALQALDAGEPRVIRLTPDSEGIAREGVIELPMTCHSGGTLEIFLEPFLPDPALVIVGDSPVASAVADLGARFDFEVMQVNGAADMPTDVQQPYVVVATMGTEDELALERGLQLQPAYVGLVGSRRRFAAIADYLRANGYDADVITAIHAPAGLDIHAETPAEIALSVLAEIVQVRRQAVRHEPRLVHEEHQPSATAIDPICGMSVDLATSRYTLNVNGEMFGFCCPACKRRFEREQAAG
jgi:xanthine dehydrogenase accessory factor